MPLRSCRGAPVAERNRRRQSRGDKGRSKDRTKGGKKVSVQEWEKKVSVHTKCILWFLTFGFWFRYEDHMLETCIDGILNRWMDEILPVKNDNAFET